MLFNAKFVTFLKVCGGMGDVACPVLLGYNREKYA